MMKKIQNNQNELDLTEFDDKCLDLHLSTTTKRLLVL